MEEGLADWDVKDLSRLVKKKSGKGTKIINRRNELSTSDLVLSVFREFEEDVSDEEETEAEDEETATNTHIINIDDSSDDEDILMTKKLPKMKGESLPFYVKADSDTVEVKHKSSDFQPFYGPPPRVAPQAVAVRVSEYGGLVVEQVDIVEDSLGTVA